MLRRFSLLGSLTGFSWLATLAAGYLTTSAAAVGEEAKPASSAAPVSFHHDVLPILRSQCFGCHQGSLKQGGYLMTDFEAMVRGGESGSAAIVPKHPDESYLLQEITPVNGQAEMPKKGPPLPEDQVALIRRWIEQGAVDDSPASGPQYSEENPPQYVRPPVITALDYAPDGRQLAVAGFHEVLLFDTSDWKLQRRLIGMSPRIESIRYSPDGKWLAVAGGQAAISGELQLWNPVDGSLVRSQVLGSDTLFNVSWSPDGHLISVAMADNTVRAFDAQSGEQKLYQRAHEDWPRVTMFTADGKHLLSAGRDMTVKLTEVETERFVDNVTSITPGALRGGVQALARHPQRNEILVGGADGTPRVYRVFRETARVIGDDSNLVRRLDAMPGRIFSVAISPDGQQLAAVSTLDGKSYLRLWAYDFDATLSEELKSILSKRSLARNLKENETVEKYLTSKPKELRQWELEDTAIYGIAFDCHGNLAAAGSNGRVHVWSAGDHHELANIDVTPPESRLAWSLETAPPSPKVDNQTRSMAAVAQPKVSEEPTPAILPSAVSGLLVEPASIDIAHWSDSLQLLVTATTADRQAVDVTDQVSYSLSGSTLGTVSRGGWFQPGQAGQGELTVSFGQHRQKIPVTVQPSERSEVDFIRDVNPILSRLGCNQGTCHGAQAGKNGFKLSLRGYDPIFDVRALTDDLAGRRFNPTAPMESLMLTKPLGLVPHAGGKLLNDDETRTQVLKAWIATGAGVRLETPRVVAIEVRPQNPVIDAIGGRQQIRVVAQYSDGKQRDVTREAFIESGNTEVATVGSGEQLTAVRRGEAPILARFEGAYAATTLTVMGDRQGFTASTNSHAAEIDRLVSRKWERMKIVPSAVCTDAEFLRRVYLDLTGLPPTADKVRQFLADHTPTAEKRAKVIDELLASETFVDHWTNKWSDLLLVNSKFLGKEGAQKFRDWIKDSVASNKPYDQFVYEILTASGSNRENPAASYFKILRSPEELVENTTHLFLAVRFNCNKCHDHPFEKWTQDQYYQTAAYFTQVALKRDPAGGDKTIGGTAVEGAKPLYEEVADTSANELKHPRTNGPVEPRFPFDCDFASADGISRRVEFARWLTSPDNPYFARSYVNRMWGYLLGKGLIEPIDDIRAGNPASIPELLGYLEKRFVDSKFDVRSLMREIANSQVYQLSIETNRWNEDDQRNYSHAMPRRLPAEVLYDAIHAVTGSPSKLPGLALGERSAALADADPGLPDGFLNNLGRPARETACECERSSELRLGSVMALVSGPTLGSAIANEKNSIQELAKKTTDNRSLVEQLYLRILNRPASDQEIEIALTVFDQIKKDHAELVRLRDEREDWWQAEKPGRAATLAKELQEAQAKLAAREAQIKDEREKAELARQERVRKAEAAIANYEKKLPAEFDKFLKSRHRRMLWQSLPPVAMVGSNATELTAQADRSILASGKASKGVYKINTLAPRSPITALRLEVLPSSELPGNGPGLASNGNFVLTELELYVAKIDQPDEMRKIKIVKAFADFEQANFKIDKTIDNANADNGGWAVAGATGVEHWAVFELESPLELKEGEWLHWELHQQSRNEMHRLGHFRLSVTDDSAEASLGLSENLALLASIPSKQRSQAQNEAGLAYFKTSSASLQKLRETLAKEKQPLPEDEQVVQWRKRVERLSEPLADDPLLVSLRTDVAASQQQLVQERVTAAEDIAWALINSPAFLFNH
jgi:WD40 repeat protein